LKSIIPSTLVRKVSRHTYFSVSKWRVRT